MKKSLGKILTHQIGCIFFQNCPPVEHSNHYKTRVYSAFFFSWTVLKVDHYFSLHLSVLMGSGDMTYVQVLI